MTEERLSMEMVHHQKLADIVSDYLHNETFKEDVQKRFSCGTMTREVFFETMRLCDDFKWTCLKRLDFRMSRMIRSDIVIENEIALQLYDELHGMHKNG